MSEIRTTLENAARKMLGLPEKNATCCGAPQECCGSDQEREAAEPREAARGTRTE